LGNFIFCVSAGCRWQPHYCSEDLRCIVIEDLNDAWWMFYIPELYDCIDVQIQCIFGRCDFLGYMLTEFRQEGTSSSSTVLTFSTTEIQTRELVIGLIRGLGCYHRCRGQWEVMVFLTLESLVVEQRHDEWL